LDDAALNWGVFDASSDYKKAERLGILLPDQLQIIYDRLSSSNKRLISLIRDSKP